MFEMITLKIPDNNNWKWETKKSVCQLSIISCPLICSLLAEINGCLENVDDTTNWVDMTASRVNEEHI